METFLVMNGYEIAASAEEQEVTILAVASSKLNREELMNWLISTWLRKLDLFVSLTLCVLAPSAVKEMVLANRVLSIFQWKHFNLKSVI